jgi:CRISPR-associated protein Cmr2
LEAISGTDGYIGVIYADGNNIGRKLEEFTSAHEYAAFSKTMLATVQENLCGALARHARKVKVETDDGESIQACSMEMLTALGSDDILVIVPGNVALQAAINLCRAFEAGMIQYRSTMSAGVVIAPHNYPMYYLENLAHQLLKSAKQKSRKLNHKATVDFMVIYSQGTVASHVETYRRQLLELPAFGRGDALSADSDVLVLYERPYTLEQLQLLLDWARKLKMEDFPMGQLYTLRSALEQGRMSATFKYLYQLARMKPNERWLFKQFEAEWFAIDKSFVPWAKRITNTGCVKYTTPLADLLELYDFAEGGNAHASDD